MPKLSFILTAFDSPRDLRVALASIAAQTFTDWEVIVCDNAIDERIREEQRLMCRMTPNLRIRYLYTGGMTAIEGAIHPRSLYLATELGVEQSKGEWLAFPNDDTYYAPVYAFRMITEAERNGWDLAYSDIVLGSPDGYYGVLGAQPTRCNIDKTNFILRREFFRPFDRDPMNYPQADGLFVEDVVRRGAKHGRVEGVYVVHN